MRDWRELKTPDVAALIRATLAVKFLDTCYRGWADNYLDLRGFGEALRVHTQAS